MATSSDAFLYDPDLQDFLRRLALKIVRDETFAEDCRQGACLDALMLIRQGRGPRPGTERGWMCCVLKNHTFEALRERSREGAPVDPDQMPTIPVDDQQTLLEHQMAVERQLEIAKEIADKNPEHVRRLMAGDGRKGEGGAKDGATRKRKERSRKYLAAEIGAALVVAAAVALLVLRFWSRAHGPLTLPGSADETLASASRKLASQSCAAREWDRCLVHLEEARRLEPARFGAAEQAEEKAAVAALRSDALAACEKADWMTCVEGLDAAKRYDAAGDEDPTVQLARSEARSHLGAAPAPAPTWGEPDSKGPGPRR